jgi:hypothetical protein
MLEIPKNNKMVKKKTLTAEKFEGRGIVAVITLSVLVLVFFSQSPLIDSLAKGNDVVIYFPEITDFPNSEEGTIVFNLGFPNGIFKVDGKEADVLMFLDSSVIPGLGISYNVNEKKVYAGLPRIDSNEVDLLDGNNHQLAYMFNRKEGKQVVVLDNQLIAESEFTGKEEKHVIVGYAVKDNVEWVESPVGIEFRFE